MRNRKATGDDDVPGDVLNLLGEGQSNMDKIQTQNFKRIKLHFLHNTKMKKTITHITVLVKLIKVSQFNIIHAIGTTNAITPNGINVNRWQYFHAQCPSNEDLTHTDRTASNISQDRNGFVISGGRKKVHCYIQT